jgi:tRNA pseudouridine55 synthase
MNDRFTEERLREGIIIPFDKPYGWTSFDLVNSVRKSLCQFSKLKKLKVGHAGTLDPLATGLLILCTGKATKYIETIQSMVKEYEAEITLGATTPSFDLETEFDKTYPIDHINNSLIVEKLKLFEGKIKQIPPVFSAKKINGIRAYEYAREGISKKMGPADVEIYELEILFFKNPVLKLRIKCSKGTYIRSLARDLGFELNSGGYISALRRTGIGDYRAEGAISVENFQKKLNNL